jgi:hypothetical protein
MVRKRFVLKIPKKKGALATKCVARALGTTVSYVRCRLSSNQTYLMRGRYMLSAPDRERLFDQFWN